MEDVKVRQGRKQDFRLSALCFGFAATLFSHSAFQDFLP